MGTYIQAMAAWARDCTAADLPPSVARRLRLQHLSLAGAVRAASDWDVARGLTKLGARRGPARRVTGGSTGRRDAVRLHAALAGGLEYDDYLLGGQTGVGAVPAAWAWSKDHTVDEVLVATAAANEVAGRVGASLLLGPNVDRTQTVVASVAAAVAAGLLEGLDTPTLSHAIALACAAPVHLTAGQAAGGAPGKLAAVAAASVAGVDAVALAQAGVEGPLDTLESPDGLVASLSWVPLRAAFTGLGSAWLSETLAYKLQPVCTWVQVPLQGFAEVLDRHVKAADKRLRTDQLARVELHVGAMPIVAERIASSHPRLTAEGVAASVRRAFGVMMVAHEFRPFHLEAGWLARNRTRILDVASKVEISYDRPAGRAWFEHLATAAAPLLAGVTLPELREAARRAAQHFDWNPAPPALGDVVSLVRSRPDVLLDRLRHSSGDLSSARLDEWQFRFDTALRVYTTRGGAWPERRTIPEASPGWSFDKTQAAVVEKFADSHALADSEAVEARRAAAPALLDVEGSEDAAGWVKDLLR